MKANKCFNQSRKSCESIQPLSLHAPRDPPGARPGRNGRKSFFLTMLRQHSQYDSRLGFSFRVVVRVRVSVRVSVMVRVLG